MDYSQLAHIPDALDHIAVHKSEMQSEDHKFSIWDFIMEHYVDPAQHTDDHQHNHEDLPMQHLHAGMSLSFPTSVLLTDISSMEIQRENVMLPNSIYQFDYQSGIYRPPIT